MWSRASRSPATKPDSVSIHASSVGKETTMANLADILETTEFTKVAGGFVFTEGPLWHPDDFYYFVDVRSSVLYRMVLGQMPTVVRNTIGGNGTTFDLQGRPDQL